jgi:prepilin-type N-terminal cleavage/methylation domain-containing protein
MKDKLNQGWYMLLQRLRRSLAGSFSSLLRLFKPRKSFTKGFTLIELLVSMLIASFIIVVMLTFLSGVLDSSRKEQAKSESQEEIQSALNYIADDMQEALYIYDATSLAAINDQLPHRVADPDPSTTPASDRCSAATKCTPVLVFWKRYSYKPTAKLGSDFYGCLPYKSGTANHTNCVTNATNNGFALGSDNFTFSLVAYYLKSDVDSTSATWSKTARILRWELKDGYRWYCADSISGCPDDKKVKRSPKTPGNPDITPKIDDDVDYFVPPDLGFNRPDLLATGTLQQNASTWRRFTSSAEGYNFATNPFTTLVDFIDDTKFDDTNITIAIPNNDTTAPFANAGCADPTNGVGVSTATSVAQRVPSNFGDATANPSQLTSFYACVSPEDVTARVYIRGNALARIQTNANFRKPNSNNLSFFPSLNTRVFGRSTLGLGKKK